MSGTPTPVQPPPEIRIVSSAEIEQCPEKVLTARHYTRDECRHRRRRLLVTLGCVTAFVVGHSLPFVVLPR